MLQSVAARCFFISSITRSGRSCCRVLQYVAVCCSECVVACCNVLQYVVMCCSVLQGIAMSVS